MFKRLISTIRTDRRALELSRQILDRDTSYAPFVTSAYELAELVRDIHAGKYDEPVKRKPGQIRTAHCDRPPPPRR